MANFVEKENIFLRIAKYLFPWKGDKPAEIIRKCIFLGAAVVLIVSLVMIISFYGSTAQDNKLNEQISSLYHGSASVTIDPVKKDELVKEYPEVNEEFLPLLEQNKDVIGWITMGDEDSPFVDNVVVQGDDNEYYLDHNLNGDYSKTGTVFVDYREKITAENTPANIILSDEAYNVTVDASVGKTCHVGDGRGALRPGLGVSKNLQAVGDLLSLVWSAAAPAVIPWMLQSIRLGMVMHMAECISDSICC